MVLAPGYRVTPKVKLVRPLGKGAMGSVWVAEHSSLKAEVAVKFITDEFQHRRPDALERFRREATAAARIKSPHVVQMFDNGVTDDGIPYIVMEHLEGESLSDRIKREGVLSIKETGLMVRHVSRALTAAHKLGVIHRDIKPQNIVVSQIHGELFAKVLDFGIAKHTDRGGEELTEPGTLVGTPEYLSRDLIALKGAEADEQVDHWALAVVAYKCLTGRIPFSGDTLALVLAALAIGKFDPPSMHRTDLPKRFDRWFTRAFHEDPNRRFGTAEELAMSFAAVVNPGSAPWDHKETQTRERVTLPQKPKARVPSKVLITAMSGLTVGVLIAIAVYAVMPRAPETATPADAGTPLDAAVGMPTDSGVATAASVVPEDAGVADAATVEPPPPVPREDEVLVPTGPVWLGCYSAKDNACADHERPGKTIETPGFFIDKMEVTVKSYQRCVAQHGCKKEGLAGFALQGGRFGLSTGCNWGRKERLDHPVNCISWNQANTYCRWSDKRLPTEVEWERAARGDDRRIFPWGDAPADCDHAVMANCGDRKGTWQVGSQVNDKSAFEIFDMAGNVREWVADWYHEGHYKVLSTTSLDGPETGDKRVARGGSWGNAVARFLRVSERGAYAPDTRSVYLGFRCARSLEVPAPATGGSSTTPNDAAPEDTTPTDTTPTDTTPDESAPDESAPDESAPSNAPSATPPSPGASETAPTLLSPRTP